MAEQPEDIRSHMVMTHMPTTTATSSSSPEATAPKLFFCSKCNRLLEFKDKEEYQLKPKRVRAKLLQFCEDQRPPYWGTWSKRSKCVGPRNPFGRDNELFDYEYKSDDDWEERPAGKSLSDDLKDKEDEEEEEKDEEEEDDGFFVGHSAKFNVTPPQQGEVDQETPRKFKRLRTAVEADTSAEELKLKRRSLSPKKFMCDLCSKPYVHPGALAQHKRRHHGQEGMMVNNNSVTPRAVNSGLASLKVVPVTQRGAVGEGDLGGDSII